MKLLLPKHCGVLALLASEVQAQRPYELSIEVDIFSKKVLIPNTCELSAQSLVRDGQISYRCNDYEETGQYKIVPGVSISIELNSEGRETEYSVLAEDLIDEANWKLELLGESMADGYSHQYYKLSDLKNSLDLYVYSLCDDELCIGIRSAFEHRSEEIVSGISSNNLYND
jgi:hypothetical protein